HDHDRIAQGGGGNRLWRAGGDARWLPGCSLFVQLRRPVPPCHKKNPAKPLNSFPLPHMSGASTRSSTGIDSGGVVTRISTRSKRVLTLGGGECQRREKQRLCATGCISDPTSIEGR